MKKIILFVFVVILAVFGSVFAQETEVEEKILNFETIGEMVTWETTAEEIYELLNEFDIEVDVEQDDEYGKTISASKETEGEHFIYVFYFDEVTELLWEVECVTALYDSEQIIPAFQSIYESYGFEDAEPYENETLAEYAADFDESYCVAGDGTIALLAGKAETEESYGQIALVLINRSYFEEM